jgi:hypothetical protein
VVSGPSPWNAGRSRGRSGCLLAAIPGARGWHRAVTARPGPEAGAATPRRPLGAFFFSRSRRNSLPGRHLGRFPSASCGAPARREMELAYASETPTWSGSLRGTAQFSEFFFFFSTVVLRTAAKTICRYNVVIRSLRSPRHCCGKANRVPLLFFPLQTHFVRSMRPCFCLS